MKSYCVLDYFEDIRFAFTAHARANLRRCSVDFMHKFTIKKLIPGLKSELKKRIDGVDYNNDDEIDIADTDSTVGSDSDEEFNVDEEIDRIMCKEYGFKNGTVSRITVWRWMKAIGMTFCKREKNYFVDSHEDIRVVTYRRQFIQRYMKHELQMYVWVQKNVEEIELLKTDGKLPERTIGYHY